MPSPDIANLVNILHRYFQEKFQENSKESEIHGFVLAL